MSDLDAVKQRQQHTWGLGDYSVLSRQLTPASNVLCDSCAVSAGQEVLDVAAGDGNFALACAREGASVVASDFVPRMVELGRARTEAEGYDVEWVEADVEDLPFEDSRFDCAGSVFGAMIAPRPEVAASELFRVVRPGGTVGLTAWVPDGFLAAMFELGRRFLPPPDDMPLPHEWGDEETAGARLEGLASHVEMERHTLPWTAPSAEGYAAEVAAAAPNFVAAREALSPEQFDQLVAQSAELAGKWNSADDGSLLIEAEYLVVVARKRG
jgi:ubiquinone/menaquinone biosynthesis C-methylase UbiE